MKTILKKLLFKPGIQERKIVGGKLKGFRFTFDLQTDTQRWRGVYEESLQHWLAAYVRKGSICLDIGAADGYFTLLMAKYAGKGGAVYAFEPSSYCEMIQKHFEMNSSSELARPIVKKAFVSSKDTENQEYIRIDSLIATEHLSRVDVVKIDVDGGEAEVLIGMKETLTRFHPHLYVEVHSLELLQEVKQITSEFGYVMEQEDPPAYEQRPLEYNAFLYSRETIA